ncbi:tetratricopeptide repeat protein [Aquimarina sp. 2201CG5-10]|uniref:tetratricopeptide repeat protein n=1 Tax=Aquimarina callyspongiae TaxID=3098150 RepID=UPI002AB4C469|nr:tetratricopeptide repeat protein [Aquimarina sp. 2201CG5-10]MDY8136869.1 hypothetical protein [Aquimarina sp. 2201CG5-10]
MEREELIDRHLRGVLTQSEKEDFDNLLKSDADFRNDVEILKNLTIVSGVENRKELKNTLTDFESKITSKGTKVVPLFASSRFWLTAASILLIIAIGTFALLNPFATNTEALFAENFEPYRNVITPIVRGENNDTPEAIAFISYESKNYEKASSQFNELFKNTKRPYFLLYQANSLLASGDTKKAIPLLKQHIELNDQLSTRSKWYLALAYLKDGQKKNAISLLEQIVALESFKKGSAEALLKKLH